jgi:putative ABC transport system substrate-binding protein
MRLWDGFRDAMREQGWREGRDVVYESRWAGGKAEDLPRLARELLGSRVEVIFVSGTPAALAAKRATSSVPVVTASSADPVGAGLAASLARPGGNVTGMSTLSPGVSGKWLQLLREVAPRAARVGVLLNAGNPTGKYIVDGMMDGAKSLAMSLVQLPAKAAADLPALLAPLDADALLVVPDPMLFSQRGQVIAFCRERRILSLAEWPEFARDGGVISYGVSLAEMYRRAALYVARILAGARPAELPFEQGSRFQLVINLRAARAIGLAIPNELLITADEVIE